MKAAPRVSPSSGVLTSVGRVESMRRFRSAFGIASKEVIEQARIDRSSGESDPKRLNALCSKAFAGERPAWNRRAWWKKAAAIELGTRVFARIASSLVRWL